MTDGKLIARSLCGEPEAFVEIVERHEVAIHGYLSRRAGHQAADDLLGEVWVRAFGARRSYDSASGHEKIPVCGQIGSAVRSSEFPADGHQISR